jgi:hypothetical protein
MNEEIYQLSSQLGFKSLLAKQLASAILCHSQVAIYSVLFWRNMQSFDVEKSCKMFCFIIISYLSIIYLDYLDKCTVFKPYEAS